MVETLAGNVGRATKTSMMTDCAGRDTQEDAEKSSEVGEWRVDPTDTLLDGHGPEGPGRDRLGRAWHGFNLLGPEWTSLSQRLNGEVHMSRRGTDSVREIMEGFTLKSRFRLDSLAGALSEPWEEDGRTLAADNHVIVCAEGYFWDRSPDLPQSPAAFQLNDWGCGDWFESRNPLFGALPGYVGGWPSGVLPGYVGGWPSGKFEWRMLDVASSCIECEGSGSMRVCGRCVEEGRASQDGRRLKPLGCSYCESGYAADWRLVAPEGESPSVRCFLCRGSGRLAYLTPEVFKGVVFHREHVRDILSLPEVRVSFRAGVGVGVMLFEAFGREGLSKVRIRGYMIGADVRGLA
jgi:hypothetical protein